MTRSIGLLAVLLPLLAILSGCITTETGGFTEKASPEEALERRVELVGDWNAIRHLLDLVDGLPGPVRTTTLRLERTEFDGASAARLELELDVLHRDASDDAMENDA